MKICRKCQIEKPLSDYHNLTKSKDGKRNICKSCISLSQKQHFQKHHGKIKDKNLKRVYGISLQQFNEMLEKQDRKCGICENDLDGKLLTHIDHCHTTGKIRAILCHYCNTGLGLFKESPDLLAKATKYLKKHATI